LALTRGLERLIEEAREQSLEVMLEQLGEADARGVPAVSYRERLGNLKPKIVLALTTAPK